MIFSLLGRSVRNFSYLWLAGWVILLLVTWHYAPSWDVVAVDRDFEFLPNSALSRKAELVYKQAFPENQLGSSIVLVLHRSDSSPEHLQQDKQFIDEVIEPGLRAIAIEDGGLAGQRTDESNTDPFANNTPQPARKTSIIDRIDTPNAPLKGDLLISPDRKALLVVVSLTTEFMVKDNWSVINRVEAFMRKLQEEKKLPPGVDLTITGSRGHWPRPHVRGT